MRAKIAGLPTGARLMLGLMTVGSFGFFGLVFKDSTPVLGWALIGFAALRAVVWVRQVGQVLAAGREEQT